MKSKMLKIIESDSFTDMPQETRLLLLLMVYNMDKHKRVYNTNAIMRSHRISELSLELLVKKGYVSKDPVLKDNYILSF